MRLWVPFLVTALSGGCDRLFSVDHIDAPDQRPTFVRADHISLADNNLQKHTTATITQADAGDTMLVAICAEADNPIAGVRDKNGTAYTSTSFVLESGLQSDVYYAQITETTSNFSVGVDFMGSGARNPDVRLVEYKNLRGEDLLEAARTDFVPDVTGGSSDPRMLTTGLLTASAVPALLVLANCVRTYTVNPLDPNLSVRVQTSPNGDIISDRAVADQGDYQASVTTSGMNGAILTNLLVLAGISAP